LLNASEAGDVTTAKKEVNKLGHKFELDPPVKQTEVSGSIEAERTVTICAACREPVAGLPVMIRPPSKPARTP
jgi:hypothetical protein